MTLKKGFLRPNLGITFTTKSIIRSTIIGVLVSFSLYAFAFYVFETLRVHPALSTMRLYIYPDQEMSLYKWFFAATSLIIGQAVATKLLFRHQNRKKTTATKTRLRVLNIQNDQTTQPTYFLHWLSSILIYFGLLINLSPTFWSYSEIDFYANYRCLFYLIPLVLWLSLWNGFLRLYKQKTYKWMVLSFITLGVLSFGLSKINLVDYNGFNENYIKNRPVLQYTYNLPSSEFSQKNERKSRIIKFYIGYKKSETNPQPTILYNEESIEMNQVSKSIESRKNRVSNSYIPFLTTVIVADKNIPMSFIDSFKNEMRSVNALRLAYTTKSEHSNPNLIRTSNYSIHQALPPYVNIKDLKLKKPPPPPPAFNFEKSDYSNKIQIKLNQDNSVILNNTKISIDRLAQKLDLLITLDPDYAINFTKDSTCTLDQYLQAQTQMRLAIKSLRDSLSIQWYGEIYDISSKRTKDIERLKQIQKAIPSLIWEDL